MDESTGAKRSAHFREVEQQEECASCDGGRLDPDNTCSACGGFGYILIKVKVRQPD